jgi:hypothetical protein
MIFSSSESITQYLDGLVECFRDCGVSEAADELHHLLHDSAWTTSSEWLGEIKLLLARVRRTNQESLSSAALEKVDKFIAFVDDAWNNANR